VSQEWVDTIGASRDRNWIAGTDEDNCTELIPFRFDGATPALDGLCNRVVGLFSRHTFAHLTRVTSKPASERDKSSAEPKPGHQPAAVPEQLMARG
jgi:hypothetical protein